MKLSAYHILRIGIGVTFVWIGFLVFKDPLAWGVLVQPWASDFLPFSLEKTMLGVAVFDIVIGVWIISQFRVWVAALFAMLHMVVVLVVTTHNYTSVIVRDIAILGATIALFIDARTKY